MPNIAPYPASSAILEVGEPASSYFYSSSLIVPIEKKLLTESMRATWGMSTIYYSQVSIGFIISSVSRLEPAGLCLSGSSGKLVLAPRSS